MPNEKNKITEAAVYDKLFREISPVFLKVRGKSAQTEHHRVHRVERQVAGHTSEGDRYTAEGKRQRRECVHLAG